MLRITVKNGRQPTILKLEGRLAGPWVDELLRTWSELRVKGPGLPASLDLSDVTYVDADGKMILSWMLRKGVKVQNANLMTKYIMEQVEHAEDFDGQRRRLI
jgi:ABC-type transporter Mla MlaB component